MWSTKFPNPLQFRNRAVQANQQDIGNENQAKTKSNLIKDRAKK